MQEVTLQNTKGSLRQCKSEVMGSAEFRQRRVRRVYQKNHQLKGRSLKVVEHLGDEGCAEEGIEKTKLWELCEAQPRGH
jgi:hypothetical protein